MIPTIHWTYYKPKMMEGHRSKYNILPTTFPRISWNSMTIHRLPRYLHYMKHHLINRINILFHKSNNIPFHHLRKYYIKPTNPTYKELGRMITKLPVSRTQILKTTNHLVLCVLWFVFFIHPSNMILLIMCVCVCLCVCMRARACLHVSCVYACHQLDYFKHHALLSPLPHLHCSLVIVTDRIE